MFHFSYPEYLLLALIIPPILFLWARQRQSSIRHPGLALFPLKTTFHARLAQWGGLILRAALAMLLLIIAAAGPRWPDLRTRIVTEGIAIGMVIDTSGSMAESDFDWDNKPISRLEAVKCVFRLFVQGGESSAGKELKGRPTDLICLVTFGTRPDSLCPLTLSHSVLLEILDELEPRTIPGESETNVSDAIVLALQRLQRAGKRRKVLVLLSDGEHNVPSTPSGWTPRQAANVAKSLSIPIYVIDAGGTLSGLEKTDASRSEEIRQAGKKTLQDIASITGGQYFKARTTEGLLEVYRIIDQAERASIESFQYRRYFEGYLWFGIAVLSLLALLGILESTFWRRIP